MGQTGTMGRRAPWQPLLGVLLAISVAASGQPQIDDAVPVPELVESEPALPVPETPDQDLPPSPLQDVLDSLAAGTLPAVPDGAEFLTPEETLQELELRKSIDLSIDLDLIDINQLREIIDAQRSPEALRLTLRDCVAIALANNHDILITEIEPLRAIADWRASRGEFDPLVNVSHQQMRARQRASAQTVLFGGITELQSNVDTSEGSVSGRLPWGTQYSIGLRVEKEESTFNQFIPEYSGGLTLTVTQPLLRGFGPKSNLARIRIARNTVEQAQNQLHLTVMESIGQVLRAYWDLVGAIENVRVREESLANAERLLETNQRRLEIGTAATIDVLQTKAQVANRQGDLVAARSQQVDAEDALKRLLSMLDEDRLSRIRIVPIDRPAVTELDLAEVQNFEVNVERSIAQALEFRPELHNAEIDIKNAAIEIARTKRDMLPQLDLTGTYSVGGRGETMSDPFRGIRTQQDELYTWNLQLSVPIGNRTARHSHTRAILTKQQSERRLLKIVEDLALNVRFAARQALTSHILVATSRQTRILQEANVAAEEKKLELGVTTSYRVLDVQEDLTIAQTQEVQALVNFEKARVELQLAEGLLLEDWGIEVEEPEYRAAEPFVESLLPFIE
jgi:outer membrane protein TolC